MAASAWRVYRAAKEALLTGTIDLDTSAMRIKIVKGTGAATVSNYAYAAGYASCGTAVSFEGDENRTLTGIDVTTLSGSNTIMFDASDKIFTASGNLTSIQYAVIGVSGGAPLCWCKLTATPISLSATNTLKITMPAGGIFQLYGGEA